MPDPVQTLSPGPTPPPCGAGWGPVLRPLLVAMLALTLTLAGASRAMALAHAGAEALVICADGGSTTILIGADGTPVKPGMDCSRCPDCLTNSAPLLTGLPLPPAVSVPAAPLPFLPAGSPILPSRHLRPMSRGPPLAAPGPDGTAPQAVSLPSPLPSPAGPGDLTERAFPDARS